MTDAFSTTHVVAMEHAASRAWPAPRVVDLDGWKVRLSGGGSRRANSVLPLAYTGRDVEASITAVESYYRAQKTRSYFQVSSISRPDDLDTALEHRGYTFEEPCLLLAKRLSPAAMPADVVVTRAPTTDWLAVYAEAQDPVRRAAAPSVLSLVPSPRAFLLVVRDGVPLSSALGVVSPDGVALVECVATLSAARRSGRGHIVMQALEAWAAEVGAHTAALQVTAGNTPAVSLYQRRGYGEVGRYHYRWCDVA